MEIFSTLLIQYFEHILVSVPAEFWLHYYSFFFFLSFYCIFEISYLFDFLAVALLINHTNMSFVSLFFSSSCALQHDNINLRRKSCETKSAYSKHVLYVCVCVCVKRKIQKLNLTIQLYITLLLTATHLCGMPQQHC